jgi:hypothetical protein
VRILLVGAVVGVATAVAVSGVLDLAVDNYNAYKLLSQEESKETSLAYFLLYDLPFPISAFASAALVLFIKIPFWRGMLFDSYNFFTSMAALQMLFIAPAFIGIAVRSLLYKVGSDVRYLVLVLLLLLFMTAMTSSQVRHFAIGYPFLILLYHMRRKIIGTEGLYVWAQHFIFGVVVVLSIAVEFR